MWRLKIFLYKCTIKIRITYLRIYGTLEIVLSFSTFLPTEMNDCVQFAFYDLVEFFCEPVLRLHL